MQNKGHGKTYIQVLAFLLAFSLVLISSILIFGKREENIDKQNKKFVASFYPIYIIGLNLIDGVSGVTVENLTPSATGCLHDFQLSPDNMFTLGDADGFLINGGGAESFLDNAKKVYPDLNVIDSSSGVDFLVSAHDHGEDESDHDEDMFANEHIWMNPDNYMMQIDNIARGMSEIDEKNKDIYLENAKAYKEKVEGIRAELLELKESLPKYNVTFHDSVEYISKFLKMESIESFSIGEEETASAKDLAYVEKEIKKHDKVLLIYDDQYPIMYKTIGGENSKIIEINTNVTPLNKATIDRDSWIDSMKYNIELFKLG